MRASKKQLKDFDQVYFGCIRQFVEEATKHKNAVIQAAMESQTSAIVGDFGQFAKDAFLIRMKEYYDHHSSMEAIIKESNNLINDKYQ